MMTNKPSTHRARALVKNIYINSLQQGAPKLSWKDVELLLDSLGVDRENLIQQEAKKIAEHFSTGQHSRNDVLRALKFIETHLLGSEGTDLALEILAHAPKVNGDVWMGDVMVSVKEVLNKVLSKGNHSPEALDKLKKEWKAMSTVTLPEELRD